MNYYKFMAIQSILQFMINLFPQIAIIILVFLVQNPKPEKESFRFISKELLSAQI